MRSFITSIYSESLTLFPTHTQIHNLAKHHYQLDKLIFQATMATLDNHPISASKVAIIGAGVSGIAAAKQLSHHNPLVFEASDSVGGVWRHCSYNSTKLQSQRRDYEFSDFPWPHRDNSDFPTHLEIVDYLHSYAEHFDVLKNIRFNSKVVEIRFVGDKEAFDFGGLIGDHGTPLPGHPVWEVAVQTNPSNTIQVFIIFQFTINWLQTSLSN